MAKIAIRWLLLVATLVLLGGTLAYGQSSSAINACYNTKTGALRYVGTETTCREPEAFISWPANADALQGQVNVLQADVSALQARVDALQARLDALTTNTVFVTSAVYNGDLGGLAGADARCQALADAAGLTGTYKAWLSDTTGSPSTRFTHSANPYVRVDGVIVADNWTDLTDGGLDASISINESGGLPGWTAAWTNTTTTGTLADPSAQCADWSTSGVADPSQLGKYGLVTRADFLWTQYPSQMWCNDMNVIYCFEQ